MNIVASFVEIRPLHRLTHI